MSKIPQNKLREDAQGGVAGKAQSDNKSPFNIDIPLVSEELALSFY
jgi:hypothetical protein